ncbi:acid phosphatase PHO12 precursor [Massarina eburnea CBS 473.64]|uniref:Acid phosphatase PHO12 n=1 Tax=Massarina eburnea CBS 473.64 TaxID=1395130 RepID=A0A6A6RHN0_9PLEO|nr:acid phosphatase PHO12 precursor [Massarina eburnea CBS 473.64]
MHSIKELLIVVLATSTTTSAGSGFDRLHHLGGNSPWFSGPEVTNISSEVPAGCTVDQAAFFSRHGSRYPDLGAYNEWLNLSSRIAAGNVTTNSSKLGFLSSWQPVLRYPEQQIAQLSTTGYKELYDMGATYRLRYDDLYDYNTPFTMWSNYYASSPRVRDSARLFARGFLGPNATELGSIYALNSSSPSSFMNSLAPSDLCPAYTDNGGSPQTDTWANIYLPPIQARLNSLIYGTFQFTKSDISIIPYLCGFETQITGSISPWCSLFTEEEVLQYEYAQDLRYWYGTGLGTGLEKYMMVPVLDGLVKRFVDGPNTEYNHTDGSIFVPNNLIAAFSNDGQINQLVAAIGVFDNEAKLPADKMLEERLFRASNFVTMRGTVGFERMSCSGYETKNGVYLRVRLNDVVYPVVGCRNGPGDSCLLEEYQKIVKSKIESAGNFGKACNVTNSEIPQDQNSATFFTDIRLPFAVLVKP